MDNHLSFSARIALLKGRAGELHLALRDGIINLRALSEAADVMLAEAQRIEAAQARFPRAKQRQVPNAH